ncbi:hypothetical protein BB561_000484 [Smittium simulii]|uniref:Reverse transcriptase domain-containing protein n=1 Tax=Smittium simulii TaxID=133385 RepID=A0A2T9YYX8_9FUNG|nr:hypothetical protein BB561_000484 [Smittium simulii]
MLKNDIKYNHDIGDQVSQLVNFNCDFRQGCPLSPILFDIYINDIFNNVPGASVPGLTTKIPGLLFSDDAVVVAETSDVIKSALNTITKWGRYVRDLFGMSEQRNSPIQKVSDQVLRLIAGVGKNTAINRLRAEITDLTKNPTNACASAWISDKTRWLNKNTKKVKSGATKNTIADRYNKNDKSKIYIL